MFSTARTFRLITALLTLQNFAAAFAPQLNNCKIASSLSAATPSSEPNSSIDRRSFFSTVSSASAALLTTAATLSNPAASYAADGEEEETKSVQTPLYNILRVREATEQETRLIKSGKFKDVQRANVKLAVRFMVDNYRLNDNFIAASAFLTGDRRVKAGDIGQNVVQNLYTILEYFDSSDVDNIKVGSSSLAGKEQIVLNGLAAAKKGIDDFLSYFPKEEVLAVVSRIENENALNEREFDKDLNQGVGILNPKPIQS